MSYNNQNLLLLLFKNISNTKVKEELYKISNSIFSLDSKNPLVETFGKTDKSSFFENQEVIIDEQIKKIHDIKKPIASKVNITFALMIAFSTIAIIFGILFINKMVLGVDNSVLTNFELYVTIISGIITSIVLPIYKNERKELAEVDRDLINIHRTKAALAIRTLYLNGKSEMDLNEDILDLETLKTKVLIEK